VRITHFSRWRGHHGARLVRRPQAHGQLRGPANRFSRCADGRRAPTAPTTAAWRLKPIQSRAVGNGSRSRCNARHKQAWWRSLRFHVQVHWKITVYSQPPSLRCRQTGVDGGTRDIACDGHCFDFVSIEPCLLPDHPAFLPHLVNWGWQGSRTSSTSFRNVSLRKDQSHKRKAAPTSFLCRAPRRASAQLSNRWIMLKSKRTDGSEQLNPFEPNFSGPSSALLNKTNAGHPSSAGRAADS
jgi:hypothetical protein